MKWSTRAEDHHVEVRGTGINVRESTTVCESIEDGGKDYLAVSRIGLTSEVLSVEGIRQF